MSNTYFAALAAIDDTICLPGEQQHQRADRWVDSEIVEIYSPFADYLDRISRGELVRGSAALLDRIH